MRRRPSHFKTFFLFMIHSPEKVEGRQCGFTLLLNTVIQIPTPGMSLIKHGLSGEARLSHGPDEEKQLPARAKLSPICPESFSNGEFNLL